MKKILASLFILGFLAIGAQAHASVLSDALLQIQNLKNEIVHLRASLKGSTADIPMPPTLGATTYSNLTPNGVTLTSSVSSFGFPPALTARGTCYGLISQGPMSNCLSDGVNAQGSYSQNRTGLIPNTSRRHRSWTTTVPMPKDAITNNSTRFVDTFLSMKFTFNNRDNKVFKLHDITTYIRPTHK